MILFTVTCALVFILFLCNFIIEVKKKINDSGLSAFLTKLISISTTFTLNVSLSIALTIYLRRFFRLLKTMASRSKSINLLKAMLATLAASYFLRAILLPLLVVIY